MKFFLLLLLFVIDPILSLGRIQFHEYCIIGAGPAGLQLAYFLQKAKRDYIVYEKSSHAGK
jgi:NADPH-dependent glutamate synthase beta subunit-like oxidoreductase